MDDEKKGKPPWMVKGELMQIVTEGFRTRRCSKSYSPALVHGGGQCTNLIICSSVLNYCYAHIDTYHSNHPQFIKDWIWEMFKTDTRKLNNGRPLPYKDPTFSPDTPVNGRYYTDLNSGKRIFISNEMLHSTMQI